jgi:hypothetical protein
MFMLLHCAIDTSNTESVMTVAIVCKSTVESGFSWDGELMHSKCKLNDLTITIHNKWGNTDSQTFNDIVHKRRHFVLERS